MLDLLLKSILILLVATAISFGWRRGAAATRHLIWLLALVGLLVLPALSLLLPGWQHPLWTVGSHAGAGNEITVTLAMAPGLNPATERAPTHPSGPGQTPAAAQPLPAAPGAFATTLRTNWATLIVAVWLSGMTWILLAILAGQWQLRQLRRRAQPPSDPAWSSLVQHLSIKLAIRRPVTMLQSADQLMPVTWGHWQPVILLPMAADAWPEERRRVVLRHELAHVQRWDCLTQLIAHLTCAIYWFNPLVWLAVRRMRLERENACDDLVLTGGCRASDYASHLVAIARTFRPVKTTAAIAMARPSQLEDRIVAIVDASRVRRAPALAWLAMGGAIALVFVVTVAAQKPGADSPAGTSGKPWYDARLRAFFVAKAAQAHELAKSAELPVPGSVWRYFDAGSQGDWQTTTNLWTTLRSRAHQYLGTKPDSSMDPVWSPILETDLAWEQFANWHEKSVLAYGRDIINSIPPGSIYFGGTDPGRGVITAMTESHAQGKPFFTLTQNALADGTYLEYLQAMYGQSLKLPTTNDSSKLFDVYLSDARKRLEHDTDHPKEPRQVKPGEDVHKQGGTVQVSGQIAVMAINALIAKQIFDQNPTQEFFIEESFPLDWMYPHLTPNGLIMKINREPVTTLSAAVIAQDHDYWARQFSGMLGDWLKAETTSAEVVAFVEKVYLHHDLGGFTGDRQFVSDEWAQLAYCKLRSAIGGLYYWRINNAKTPEERQEMIKAADFAFRQAYALCPTSPEALFRYVQLLVMPGVDRVADARLLAETTSKLDPGNDPVKGLLQQLKAMAEKH